jgi:CNT family concentrative nucleoside transporter
MRLRFLPILCAGLLALIGICFLFSNNRSRVDWRLVAWGVGLQIFFAVLVLNTAPGMWVFARLNDLMMALLGFTRHGTDFLFGSFLTGRTEPGLVNLAFQVLPTIIFFSSLMADAVRLHLRQRTVPGCDEQVLLLRRPDALNVAKRPAGPVPQPK